MPCNYAAYSVVGEPQSGSGQSEPGTFGWGFNFASTDVRVEQEAPVYPLISFVAELGGSLGLCLGVSFLSAWDLIEFTAARTARYKVI